MIEPQEIANLVAYVASPLSSATNGAALRVDGGVIPRSAEHDDYSCHTSPGRNMRKRCVEIPASVKASASAMGGASIGSSVSWNVP